MEKWENLVREIVEESDSDFSGGSEDDYNPDNDVESTDSADSTDSEEETRLPETTVTRCWKKISDGTFTSLRPSREPKKIAVKNNLSANLTEFKSSLRFRTVYW